MHGWLQVQLKCNLTCGYSTHIFHLLHMPPCACACIYVHACQRAMMQVPLFFT